LEIVLAIEGTATDAGDAPKTPVVIADSGELPVEEASEKEL
jgi:hypothetical protein